MDYLQQRCYGNATKVSATKSSLVIFGSKDSFMVKKLRCAAILPLPHLK